MRDSTAHNSAAVYRSMVCRRYVIQWHSTTPQHTAREGESMNNTVSLSSIAHATGRYTAQQIAEQIERYATRPPVNRDNETLEQEKRRLEKQQRAKVYCWNMEHRK